MKAEIGLTPIFNPQKTVECKRNWYAQDHRGSASEVLLKDLSSVIAKGLEADIGPPDGRTGPSLPTSLPNRAGERVGSREEIPSNREEENRRRKPLRQDTERMEKKAQKTDFKEAVVSVYSRLAESLMDNQPYF